MCVRDKEEVETTSERSPCVERPEFFTNASVHCEIDRYHEWITYRVFQ